MPSRRPNEVSAGGVLARPTEAGWEVCLVRVRAHWGLPKGHVEKGESPQRAALREISEECGVAQESLLVVAPLPDAEYVYRRDGRLMFKLVHHFLVTTGAGARLVAQVAEIDQAEWMSIDEALTLASFGDTRTALGAARPELSRLPH